MKHIRLALLGFGNVGQALVRLLARKEEELRQKYQLSFTVTAIATGSRGRAINPDGLDVQAALELVSTGKSLDGLSVVPAPSPT